MDREREEAGRMPGTHRHGHMHGTDGQPRDREDRELQARLPEVRKDNRAGRPEQVLELAGVRT